MGEAVELTGTILDKSEMHTVKVNQEFLLVEDSGSGKKYAVYISLDRSSSLRARKFRKEEFQVGDVVRISGKIQKLVSKSVAGMKIVQQSDLEYKDAGIMAYANVLVPKEMSKVQDSIN
ncbi:MAG TPA: hypothetical protein VIK02_04085 [Candidatus Anoxymicrobiaceae bacterium]